MTDWFTRDELMLLRAALDCFESEGCPLTLLPTAIRDMDTDQFNALVDHVYERVDSLLEDK